MATHSSILAWEIPMDRGAWWAAVHGVTQSQTRLKRFSTHTCPVRYESPISPHFFQNLTFSDILIFTTHRDVKYLPVFKFIIPRVPGILKLVFMFLDISKCFSLGLTCDFLYPFSVGLFAFLYEFVDALYVIFANILSYLCFSVSS